MSFYVSLFSNSSLEKFPENSASKFQVALPKVLDFSQGNWVVGVIEIFHPRILGGVSNSKNNGDVVNLPFIPSEKSFQYDLEQFIDLLLKSSARPEIYWEERYYEEFLNKTNLESFEINLKKYATETIDKALTFKISPFPKKPEYRTTMKKKDYIFFEAKRNYSMKQILYKIMEGYFKIFRDDSKEFKDIERGSKESIFDALYLHGLSFINSIRSKAATYNPNPSCFVLIYGDFIVPSIVGPGLSKVLYSTRRKVNAIQDSIKVDHVHYIEVNKKFVENIAIFFSDEYGQQLMMEDSFDATYILLHFKQV